MFNIDKVNKTYISGTNKVDALKDVCVKFPKKGLVFLLGKSGSGKTTLLNLLGGLDDFNNGKIFFNNDDISNYNTMQLDNFRNKNIGFIFQDYNLIEELNVFQNIKISLDIQYWENKSDRQSELMIKDILEYVDLNGYERRKVKELSGGQRQRVAIARALVKKPKIILADEPTGNLDERTSEKILDTLQDISKQCLVIVVSHNESAAKKYADSIINIKDGKIISNYKNAKNNDSYSTYSLEINDLINKNIKKYQNINYNDINMIICDLLPSSNKRKSFFNIKIDNNVSFRNEKINEKPERATITTQKIENKNILSLSCMNLARKKIRLMFTIILFALTLTLLFFATHIYFYNKSEIISKYFNEYNSKSIYLFESREYTNNLFKTIYFNINKGESYKNKLDNLFSKSNTYGIINEFDITSCDNLEGFNINNISGICMDNNSEIYYNLAIGGFPKNHNEIVITDYIAAKTFGGNSESMNKYIMFGQNKMKIVGVLKTDYISYKLLYKIMYNINCEYTEFNLMRKYNIALINNLFVDNMKLSNKSILLPYSNFLLKERESQYLDEFSSELLYNSVLQLNNNDLFYGKMPSKDNEVLISFEMAKKYNIINEAGSINLDNAYCYINTNDTKYNGCYENEINLYNYFPQGVKITGIFNVKNNYYSDVLVTNNIYNKLSDKYYKYYVYSEYGIYSNTNNFKSIVNLIVENKLIINEPSVTKIYDFNNSLLFLKSIILLILILVFIITFFMIYNYISFSIKNNSKKIGILRALGVTKIDTLKIFIFESIIISIISLLLCLILSGVFIAFVNSFFRSNLSENPFDIIFWNFPCTLFVICTTFIIGLGSSVLPIISLSKKQPINIIKEII